MAELKDLLVNGLSHLIGDAIYKTHAATVSDDRIASTLYVTNAVNAKADTKDTAGSGNTDSKIFLVGTPTLVAGGTKSYSDSSTWVLNGTLNTSFLNVTTINGVVPKLTDTTYTLSAGDANGQVKLTPSTGSAINVTVTGINNAAYKGVDTIVTPTSRNLPDSSAVAAYVNSQMVSVLTYKGTIGTGGTTTSLPTNTSVGWVYVVKTAGTYAGKACEPGDYILCQTTTASAGNNDWDIITGENQITFSNPTLAAPGSSVSYVTSEGTTYYIKTPSTWKVTDTVYTHPGKTVTVTTSSKNLTFGDSFKTINTVSYDSSGHIATVNVSTLTLPTLTTLSLSTSGNGNAITTLSVNDHGITIGYGTTFLTENDLPSLVLSTSGTGNAITTISVNGHEIEVGLNSSFVTLQDFIETEYAISEHINQLYNDVSILNARTVTVSLQGSGNGIASMTASGHAITATMASFATSGHKHGNVTNDGKISTSNSIANGDAFVIARTSAGTISKSTITFDGSTTTSYLSKKGTWESIPTIPSITASTTGSGNFVTAVTASGHAITITKGNVPSLTLATHGSGNGIATMSVNGHTIDVTLSTFATLNTTSVTVSVKGSGNAIASITASGGLITATLGTFATSDTTYSFGATSPIAVAKSGTTVTYSHATSGVTAGTYGSATQSAVITVNATGHITSATVTNITDNDHTYTIKTSGSITSTASTSGQATTYTLSHATSGVTAGGYGSGTKIPVITVSAEGHVTSVSTITHSHASVTLAAPGSAVTYSTIGSTGYSITTPSTWTFTDEKVKQTSTTSDIWRPILASQVENPNGAATASIYNASIGINPGKKAVKIFGCQMVYNETTKSLNFEF